MILNIKINFNFNSNSKIKTLPELIECKSISVSFNIANEKSRRHDNETERRLCHLQYEKVFVSARISV